MKASLRDVVVYACNLSSWEAFSRKEGGSLMGTFLWPLSLSITMVLTWWLALEELYYTI